MRSILGKIVCDIYVVVSDGVTGCHKKNHATSDWYKCISSRIMKEDVFDFWVE